MFSDVSKYAFYISFIYILMEIACHFLVFTTFITEKAYYSWNYIKYFSWYRYAFLGNIEQYTVFLGIVRILIAFSAIISNCNLISLLEGTYEIQTHNYISDGITLVCLVSVFHAALHSARLYQRVLPENSKDLSFQILEEIIFYKRCYNGRSLNLVFELISYDEYLCVSRSIKEDFNDILKSLVDRMEDNLQSGYCVDFLDKPYLSEFLECYTLCLTEQDKIMQAYSLLIDIERANSKLLKHRKKEYSYKIKYYLFEKCNDIRALLKQF